MIVPYYHQGKMLAQQVRQIRDGPQIARMTISDYAMFRFGLGSNGLEQLRLLEYVISEWITETVRENPCINKVSWYDDVVNMERVFETSFEEETR